jgi:hypothetical protein
VFGTAPGRGGTTIAAPVAPRDGAAGIRVQQGGALALDAPFDVGVLRPIETEALRPNV